MARPSRSMPVLPKIVAYWAAEDRAAIFPNLAAHWIGWSEPFCFRCGWLVPLADPYAPASWSVANGWLEKAHLVDFCVGGPNTEDNLVPLCTLCHRFMPELIEDQQRAIDWVNAGEPNGMWQMATDAKWAGGEQKRFPGRSVFLRFRLWFDELVSRELARELALEAA